MVDLRDGFAGELRDVDYAESALLIDPVEEDGVAPDVAMGFGCDVGAEPGVLYGPLGCHQPSVGCFELVNGGLERGGIEWDGGIAAYKGFHLPVGKHIDVATYGGGGLRVGRDAQGVVGEWGVRSGSAFQHVSSEVVVAAYARGDVREVVVRGKHRDFLAPVGEG